MERGRGAPSGGGPLRVLWLIDSLALGGAETLALTFARAVEPARVRLQVACLKTIRGNPLEPQLRATGVPLTHLRSHGLRDVFAFRRLLRLLRAEQIEVVHAHLTDASIWAALAARLSGARWVATLHVAPVAAGPPMRRRLLSWALRRSAGTIAVSEWVRKRWVDPGLVPAERMAVVYNGVEPGWGAGGDRAALGLPPGPLALSVSVLREGKGLDTLLRAMARLPEAALAVAGEGPARTRLQTLAEEIGVGGRITWLGLRRDVRRLMAASDVIALASVDDPLPTVLLEAMAEGRPVVAARSGGIPEIVEDGRTGLLVPPDDPAALAEAIGAVLRDASVARALGMAGRQRIAAQFSAQAWCDRLEWIYREAAR